MLDSTRPIGETSNTLNGRPKTTSAGVLSQCLEATQTRWYVLRATYARELKVKDQINDHGLRSFIPMMWKDKKLVPAITGLVFVNATREQIDRYIRSFGDDRPVNYYWDRTANRPLTVPDKAMEDFISVASTMDPDLIEMNWMGSTLPRSAISSAKARRSSSRKAPSKASKARSSASANPAASWSRSPACLP